MKTNALPALLARSARLWAALGRAARLLPLLLLLTLPAVVQAQFNYKIDNGTITITGYTGPAGAVDIPSTIDGLPVTSIGDNAFTYRSSVTSVTIPDSVTSIGVNAFYGCTSLTSVTIPNNVTSIGDRAFFVCTSLTAITVDALNSAYSSVDGVLFNKSQTTIIQYPGGKAGSYTIPNSVTSVGVAFQNNTSLTSVTIPDSVTSIGDRAFSGCTSPTSATIPDNVSSIGRLAFNSCTSLTSVTIGHSVTNIGDYVFGGCTSLTNVTIPNSVISIEGRAFADCTSLTRVYFSGSAPSVDSSVFEG